MCTVIFLPRGHQHFSFIAVRDENVRRLNAVFPQTLQVNDHNLIFPQDRQSGGSWIAYKDNGIINCLMNGAYKKYKKKAAYRMSRGLVLLDSCRYPNLLEFTKDYDFMDIEPFTILSVNNPASPEISEFRWDGLKGTYKALNKKAEPLIWSSASIYAPQIQIKKENAFFKWLNNTQTLTDHEIYRFIKSQESHFLLKQKEVMSVSITSIHVKLPENAVVINYQDLIEGVTQELCLNSSFSS